MQLTPKVLNALINIKKELLAQAPQIQPKIESEPIKIEKKPVRRTPVRRARIKSQAFQTACRRRDWWSPIY